MLKIGLVLLLNHRVDKQVFFLMNHHDEALVIMSLLQLGSSCVGVIYRLWLEESGSGVDGLERMVEDLDVLSGI